MQVWKERAEQHAAGKLSNFHAAVSRTLGGMRVAHASSVCVGHGIFLADILTSAPQMVIMVDGPGSFTCNTCQPLGAPAAQHERAMQGKQCE